MKKYSVGDIVETRKAHPCGEKRWTIIRFGADVKIQCVKCKRIVMIERTKFYKSIKS